MQSADTEKFLPEEIEHLNDMWEMFGQFSATKLRNMSHQEPPYTNTPKRSTISRDSMKRYFITQLVSKFKNPIDRANCAKQLPQSARNLDDWRRHHPIFSVQYTVPDTARGLD